MYPLVQWLTLKRGYTFGVRTFYNWFHVGDDLIIPRRNLVIASFSGRGKSRWTKTGGWIYYLTPTGMNIVIRFMHLHRILKTGEIRMGETIALTGNTGTTTTIPHLHVDISKNKVISWKRSNFINPSKFNWLAINEIDMPHIRRKDGQISILQWSKDRNRQERLVILKKAWEKMGKPNAPTWIDADYNRYPEAGTIRDVIM